MFKARQATLMSIAVKATEPAEARESLFISPLAQSMIGESRLQVFSAAIQETGQTIQMSSALPGQEQHAEAVDAARKQIDSFIFGKIKDFTEVKEFLLLKLMNVAIKAQQKGNCAEFAFYTHFLLAKKSIPNEIFRIKGVNQNDSHVFLVVNRDPLTPADDFTQWNQDALVVDPFLGKIYMASEMEEQLQSCFHDRESDKVNYIPFNPEIHRLDNQVKQEFVADWQEVIRLLSQDTGPRPNAV